MKLPNRTEYRVYPNGDVVHEDYFDEYDNAQPYYDDYASYSVPNLPKKVLQEMDHMALPWCLWEHLNE